MDNLTHSLFALTLAQTPMRGAGRGVPLALLLSSNAPDAEIVTTLTGGPASYLAGHRGITHGPVGVVALGAAAALVVRWLYRKHTDAASFSALLAITMLGGLCHVLMDLPTSYGTRLLSPFSATWYATDWMPIIDVYLLGILAAAIVLGRLRPALRSRAATAALVLMAADYAARGSLHHLALMRAASELPPAPAVSAWADTPQGKLPFDRPCAAGWSGSRERPDPSGQACPVDRAALPTVLSPFRWRLVREYSNGYAIAEIDLLSRSRRDEPTWQWHPSEADNWVRAARQAPLASTLLRFSRFPAARVVETHSDGVVVRIEDVRFLPGADAAGEERRARGLFSVLVRLGPAGQVLEQRFGS
jgi:inner membrane protein